MVDMSTIVKILQLLFLSTLLLAIGFALGKYPFFASIDSDEMHTRITALENFISAQTNHETYTPLLNNDNKSDKVSSLPAENIMTIQQSLAKRLETLEKRLDNYNQNVMSLSYDDQKGVENALMSEQILEESLEIIGRAEEIGYLDESMHEELNTLLPDMDRKSNKHFWERLHTALDAGNVVLPEVEQTDKPWPQTVEAMEVTGELLD